ncbi:MAG: hypothetical protein ACQERJ_02485 [Bacillota bacterium]
MEFKNIAIKLVFLFLTIIVLSACNNSLLIKKFNIDSKTYQQQEYFLPKRTVNFSVEIENNTDEELDYKWTATGGEFLKKNQNQVKYKTPNLPGEYDLFLTVTNNSGEQINHQFSFQVKGDYPSEVSLTDISTSSLESGVELNWSQYQEDDFHTYKILRSSNHFIDSKAQVVGTITDKNQTSYVDHDIKPQQEYSYQIMVINREGYLSVSNEKMINTLGPKIKKTEIQGQFSDIVRDGSRSKLYLNDVEQQRLLVIDSNSQQVEQKIDLDNKIEKMFLGEQQEYLWLLGAQGKKLIKIDLEDFSEQQFDFNQEIKDISLTANQVYAAVAGEYNLIEFDIGAEEITNKYKITDDDSLVDPSQIGVLEGQYLFIDKVFGESLIYQLSDLTEPITKFDIGIVKNSIFYKTKDETLLYVANTHNPLQVYGGVKSGKIYLKNKFDKLGTPNDMVIDHAGEQIFIAVDKTIYIYSIPDNELLDKIKLQRHVNQLVWDQKQLYLLTSQINGENHNLMKVELD